MVNISQCFHILGIIIPTDNIFQRDWNVLKLPTRKTWFITGQWWFYTGIFGILVSNMIHARIYTWGSHRTKSNIVQLSMLYYAEGNSLDMYTYSMIFYEFYDISVSYLIHVHCWDQPQRCNMLQRCNAPASSTSLRLKVVSEASAKAYACVARMPGRFCGDLRHQIGGFRMGKAWYTPGFMIMVR